MHQINEQCFRYFSEIIHKLKSTNRYEEVLALIVDRIVRSFKCQTCAIVLIDPKTEYLHIDNSHNLSLTFCNSFRKRIATTSVGQLLWTGKPIVIADEAENPSLAREIQLENPFRSCICTQIAVDQRTLGYLHVDSHERQGLTHTDLGFLQVFADLAGLALVKAHLCEENLRLDRIDRETGVDKYGPFLEKLKATTERALQFNENFALAILDVDNFKDTVNTYGFEASRQLLKEMGDLVRSAIRSVDAVGRYGFDEFIVMRANTGLEGGIEFAEHLCRQIADKAFAKQGIRTTVSIGVAAFPRNGDTTDAIIVTAKTALFEAQRKGRNTVQSFKSAWYEKPSEDLLHSPT